MPREPRYKRVLVKLSGESFCSPGGFGIEAPAVAKLVDELLPLVELKVQVALVVGGGNFVRGRDLAANPHIQRATADYMGMLSTVINAIALQDALESRGAATRVLGAITMTAICEPFIRRRAIRHLEKGRIVILAGGTGNPFFTTDTCAALRASELHAEVLLKATKVDGVYSDDPHKNPSAIRYTKLTYDDVVIQGLKIIDVAAMTLCKDNHIPVIVFNLQHEGNIRRVIAGEPIGTRIGE